MGAIPLNANIPSIVNIDLANTLDFHVATTNWLQGKGIEKYANEIALYYIYNYTKHTADPITSQVNFFLNINTSYFDLFDDERGSINREAVEGEISGYKMSKLDTLLSPTEVWIRSDDGLPERRTQSAATSAYHAFNLETNRDTWYTFDHQDPDKLVTEVLGSLQGGYGISMMPLEFLHHWYEKFHTAHDSVKEEYNQVLSAANFPPEDDFFLGVSDSIGCLTRVVETVDPVNVNVGLDRNFDTVNTPVTVVPPNAYDKLDKNTKLYDSEMCEKVNSVFRNNIKNVISDGGQLGGHSVAHQQNMLPDYRHRHRINDSIVSLNGLIAQTVGVAYPLLLFTQNAESKQEVVSPMIDEVVEDSIIKVDMLKNTIQNIEKSVGNSILSSRSINSPDLS
tara:strand:+ start:2584 stop:3765 length:1182 start_codon:yes stop_codon:yes gene_type:complete